MAISSVAGFNAYNPYVNTQQVKVQRDADGDNDGSKAGEVEKQAAQQAKVSSISTLGSIVDTTA